MSFGANSPLTAAASGSVLLPLSSLTLGSPTTAGSSSDLIAYSVSGPLQLGGGNSLRQPVASLPAATESQGAFLVGASLMYQAVDLADVIVGQDLWRYDYALEGTGLLAGQGLTIFFDYQNYASLQSPPPGVAGWDILAVQPDTLLSSAGFFDALALGNVGNLSGVTFSIEFVWLGQGVPGAQPFSFYDSTNGFAQIAGGQTSAVPEPAAIWLGMAGLGAWFAFARVRARVQ